MPDLPNIPDQSGPSTLCRGLSRARVAANLGISVYEVERIERVALAKMRAELLRRGLDFEDLDSARTPDIER